MDLDMVEIDIPAPDAAGYFHFTYITTDRSDGRWYGGKRSTKKHPTADRYLGSGNWIKAHPARERLQRRVVAFYPTSVEVFAAEAEMVTWAVVNGDPLCMNLRDGGEGVTAEAALLRYADPEHRAAQADRMRRITADPAVQAKMRASALLRFEDPEQHAKQTAHMRQIASDPALIAKARVARDTPQWRANVIAANRRKAKDPEYCAKQSAITLRLAAAKRASRAGAT